MLNSKKLYLVLVLALCLAMFSGAIADAKTPVVKIMVNGNNLDVNPAPIIVNGRVLVPLRAVSEALKAKVNWYPEDGRVEVKRGFKTIKMWIPSKEEPWRPDWVEINGSMTDLEVQPRVINGRTFVPVRVISEAFDAEVNWDKSTYTVKINVDIPQDLTGLAASVRDAVYYTITADSYKYDADVQAKAPSFPVQMNLLKISGAKDKQGNYFAKGHIFGYSGEILMLKEDLLVKSLLFNDQWTSLTQTEDAKTQAEFLKTERDNYEEQLKVDGYDYSTEAIRGLGDPKVVVEETVNGILCQKIQFTPNRDSAEVLKDVDDSVQSVIITLWIGKNDNRLHKAEGIIKYTEMNYLTEKEEEGFIQFVGNYWDINGDFTAQSSSDYKKTK